MEVCVINEVFVVPVVGLCALTIDCRISRELLCPVCLSMCIYMECSQPSVEVSFAQCSLVSRVEPRVRELDPGRICLGGSKEGDARFDCFVDVGRGDPSRVSTLQVWPTFRAEILAEIPRVSRASGIGIPPSCIDGRFLDEPAPTLHSVEKDERNKEIPRGVYLK